MPDPTRMTFHPPGQADTAPPVLEEPCAAVIEIVERHQGTKRPYHGPGSILLPNHLRINGTAVYATTEEPATIREIALGEPREPFVVTLRLMARALRTGAPPSFTAGAEDVDAVRGAVIEIPDYDEPLPDSGVNRPYVLVNGRRIYTAGAIYVEEMATHGDDQNVLIVSLSLLCRKLTVDDEPLAPPVS